VVDELSAAALAILDAREADDTPRLAEGLRPLPGSWRARPSYLVQTEARDSTGACSTLPDSLHACEVPSEARRFERDTLTHLGDRDPTHVRR
jgi:hypothetical protein